MSQSSKVATCLWYDGVAEDAATFYTSLIPDSGITGRFRPDPEAPPLLVEFTLAGVPYQALNGGPHFTLSEAASIVVLTDDQAETDRLWEALTADGGSESQCGWLRDRYGLSWQICPRRYIELATDPDREAAGRATQAMLKMRKMDIAALEAAFRGDGGDA